MARFKYIRVILVHMNWMTETDRKSLVALTTYPGMSGKEISEITGISQSSLLRSKRRLLEAGVIKPVKIPNFGRVGLDLLFIGSGALKRAESDQVPVAPEIFLLARERSRGFALGVERSYLELYKMMIKYKEECPWLDDEKFVMQKMPVELTKFWRVADYGPMLATEFRDSLDEDMDLSRKHEVDMGGEPYHFKKGEWDVYRAIVSMPTAGAEKLAEILGTSRQRVYRLDRVFREEKLYIDRYIPNLNALGYEMLMFASWKMAVGEFEKLDEYMKKGGMASAFTVAGTPLEGMMLAGFHTFRDSSRITEKINRMRASINADKHEMNLIFLSIPDMEFVTDFSRLLSEHKYPR